MLLATQADVDALKQRVSDLKASLDAALAQGDVARTQWVAKLAAEANGELNTCQARLIAQKEEAWIQEQRNKLNEIQESITQERTVLVDAQRFFEYLIDQLKESSASPIHEPPVITKTRHNIRVWQVILEQQILKADSIDMASHPASLNDEQAAIIAANPYKALESLKRDRKAIVKSIQQELTFADTFAAHVDAFEDCVTFVRGW